MIDDPAPAPAPTISITWHIALYGIRCDTSNIYRPLDAILRLRRTEEGPAPRVCTVPISTNVLLKYFLIFDASQTLRPKFHLPTEQMVFFSIILRQYRVLVRETTYSGCLFCLVYL